MEQLVSCSWKDAWQDQENFQTVHGIALTHGPMMVTTIGWLIQNDDIGVSVANEKSVQDDGEIVYRGRTFIPKEMLVSIVHHKLVKPRKPKAPKPDLSPLEPVGG